MKYVVTKNPGGAFTGLCSEEAFNKHRDIFLDDGDIYEVFEGPAYDGHRATFERVKRLAKARCKGCPP